MAQVNLGHVVGPGVPTGGTANQVLVKNGSSNFDTSWKDAGTIPAIANVQDGLAIVANGNTHAAIASGQFVYVKNHGSLAEGLYKATEAIGTNATLSTSNLTADSAGGLNALKADVDSLNSDITSLKKLNYVDISDSSPVNITNKTSELGHTVHQTDFICAVSQDSNVICLPYYDSNYNKMYCLLKDTSLNNVTGTKTIRIYYRT